MENQPDNRGLILLSGWLEFLDNSPDAAMTCVRQVLASEPKNASARTLHFELLAEQRNYPEAERTIIALLGDHPEEARYYGLYAFLMLLTLNFEKAKRLAREGVRHDPHDVSCLTAQSICDIINRPSAPTSDGLQRLMMQHPESTNTLGLLIAALIHRRDYASARRLSEELVRHSPDDENVIDLAQRLKVQGHWSMGPLRPMHRFGWSAAVAIWLTAVLGVPALSELSPLLGTVFLTVFLIFFAYSWIWPPLLRRMVGT